MRAALKRWLFAAFMALARRVGPARMDGKPVGSVDRLLYALGNCWSTRRCATRSAFSRVRVAYTAGEAIGPDLFSFYRSIGINLKQLYGSTETAVFVCLQPDGEVTRRHRGHPDRRRRDQGRRSGEILVRSAGLFKEYYKNPEATAEVLTADGWYPHRRRRLHRRRGPPEDHRPRQGRRPHRRAAPTTARCSRRSTSRTSSSSSPTSRRPWPSATGARRSAPSSTSTIEAVGNWAERRGLPYAGYTDLAQKAEVRELVARVRREGQRRPRRRREAGRQPDQPLPDPAQGARRRRRRAHAHAQGAARLHRRASTSVLVDALYGGKTEQFVETRGASSRTAAPARSRRR